MAAFFWQDGGHHFIAPVLQNLLHFFNFLFTTGLAGGGAVGASHDGHLLYIPQQGKHFLQRFLLCNDHRHLLLKENKKRHSNATYSLLCLC